MVSGIKWDSPTHHLIHNHTHSPPIHCPSIVIVFYNLESEFIHLMIDGKRDHTHFRSQELWRTTEGSSGVSKVDSLFAESKVYDLDVSLLIQHQALQLSLKSIGYRVEVGNELRKPSRVGRPLLRCGGTGFPELSQLHRIWCGPLGILSLWTGGGTVLLLLCTLSLNTIGLVSGMST